MATTEIITGSVRKVIWYGNNFAIFAFQPDDSKNEMVCKGAFDTISDCDCLTLTGHYVTTQKYGRQFCVDSYESKLTPDVAAYAKYLVKFIGGIGQVKANDIAEAFGEDMFKIIQEQPERLTEIKGISAKIAQDVHEQVEKKKATQDIDLFFIRLGVTSKIQQNALLDKYGDKTVKTLSENPYLLTELHGIGFLRADQSALAIGISPKSYYRLSEGLIYTLSQGSALNGHTCMPKAELIDSAVDQLNVERELVAEALERCINEGRLVNDEGMIYNPKTLDKENNIARQMRYHLLSQTNVFHEDDVNKAIAMVEEQTNTTLDPSQREAVARSLLNNVSIITGGPGTGKTTTLNVLIKSLELLNKGIIAPIFLAAPTGLAAKRMSAQTGKRATTIHVMLGEIAPTNQQDRKIQTEFLADKAREKQRIKESERFARSTIVIDEMSMVDTDLMNKLVNQANSNARFIFVGDVDQLPSIGAGNVLKDMIDSKIIPVSRLTKVHRQAEQSSIIMNAHRINSGLKLDLKHNKEDFIMIHRDDADEAADYIVRLMTKVLPEHFEITPRQVQILAPMKKGKLGVTAMNTRMQDKLNPKAPNKKEFEYRDVLFREGDKVMNTKNLYKLEWTMADGGKGSGVLNGEVGTISRIFSNEYNDSFVQVTFDDGKIAVYDKDSIKHIVLAYAITVHKSQGSEYPCVIIPTVNGGPPTLYNRNLIYTAVTRAKNCVVFVGTEKVIHMMVANTTSQKRYTGLKKKIRGQFEYND